MKKETNADVLKKMDIPALTEFLKSFRKNVVFNYLDIGKWLASDSEIDCLDLCGVKGIFHDKDRDIPCRILENKKFMKSEYVRILIKKRTDNQDVSVYLVPAYLVTSV